MIRAIIRFPFFVLVLIAGAVAYNDYRTWDTDTAQNTRAQIEAAEQDLLIKKTAVERARAFEEQKATKLRDLQALAAELESTRTAMPRNANVPELLRSLADTADKTGLRFDTFKPAAQERREFIVITPIEVTLKGTYVQIMSFLDTAANLPRVVAAQSLALSLPKGTQRATANILTARTRLVTYHLDESYSPTASATPAPGGGK